MSTRNRVFLGILLIYIFSVGFVLHNIIDDLDPRYRESAEESQVETAYLLASVIEQDLGAEDHQLQILQGTFRSLYAKRFNAQIYSLNKTRVEMRVYVTDRSGKVIFDSTGQADGQDFSRWRDVRMALTGEYGARTTRDVEADPRTSVMYVSVPIHRDGVIAGTVTVGKPVLSFGQFVANARHKIIGAGVSAVIAFVLLALIVSVWLVRPFGFIGDYIRFVRQQRNFSPRSLVRRALVMIGSAWNEMRDALAGRQAADRVVLRRVEPSERIRRQASAAQVPADGVADDVDRAERGRVAGVARRQVRQRDVLADGVAHEPDPVDGDAARRQVAAHRVGLDRPVVGDPEREVVGPAAVQGDVHIHGDPVQEHERGVGRREVAHHVDDRVPRGVVAARVSRVRDWGPVRMEQGERLAPEAHDRVLAGRDVLADGDRRRGALSVEEGARGDVQVPDDVDHRVRRHVAEAGDGHAGVRARADRTAAAGVRRRARRGHRRCARQRKRGRHGERPENPQTDRLVHER